MLGGAHWFVLTGLLYAQDSTHFFVRVGLFMSTRLRTLVYFYYMGTHKYAAVGSCLLA